MSPTVVALSSLLSVMGLWGFFFWLWRDYRTDLLRQQLFDLRDELFDLAVRGRVSFQHPAYGLLRTTLNGFIRFAHRLRFFAVVATLLGTRREQATEAAKEAFLVRWRTASAELTTEQHKVLLDILVRMNFVVAKHVIATSLFLVLTVIPVFLVLLLEALRRNVTGRLRAFLTEVANPLDTHAMALGLEG